MRAGTIDWQPDDLRSVCEFLSYFPAQQRFRNELLELGVAKFPAIPHFAFWSSMEEFNRRRTEKAEIRVEKLLSSAISSHQAGPVKLSDKDLETAMAGLSAVREIIEHRNQFDGYMSFNSSDDDEESDEFDDDSDDDEENGFPMPFGSR